MCRNIRTLHNFEPPATEDEVRAAAEQYVRKISGTAKPSHANEAVFERAVDEVAKASSRLLASLVTSAPRKDREVEAARARARAAQRFGATASGFLLTVTRRRDRHQSAEQPRRRGGDFVHGPCKRRLVRLRRLRRAADLADVLERSGAHLVLGGGRLEVVQRADVPAHGRSLVGRRER